MPEITLEDLELESGFADDFDAVVTHAHFEVNEEYAARSGTEDPLLVLTLKSPQLENEIDSTGFSCGSAKRWQIERNGKEIVSETHPESHQFNMNANAGKLIARLITLGSKEFFLGRKAYMTQGEFYEGINCHWKREALPTVSGGSSDVLMPNLWLGAVKPVAEGDGVNPELVAQVVELASGKSPKELKSAVIKQVDKKSEGYKVFIQSVLSGTLFSKLEEDAKLVEVDGKYV